MIQTLRREAISYAAVMAMVPKSFLVYKIWVWMEFVVQIMAMVILVYFWRAVYSSSTSIAGMDLQQTLNYILLAQILMPLIITFLILNMGSLVREGQVGIELLRPLDMQARFYAESLAGVVLSLLLKLPLLVVARVFFGLQLPGSPAVWGAFLVSMLLGHAILFVFDWIFASLAFYSTEIWGLNVLREGFATFFSGALIPLVMMPGWLQSLAHAMPFAQVIYVPVSLLTGVTPLEQAPRLWLVQLAWLVGLALVSRLVFRFSVQKVTVQGG